MRQLLILNGRVIDPAERLDRNMTVVIEGGKIARLEPPVTSATAYRSGDRIIDASGKLVLPGLIDMHVHLRDPGKTEAEDIKSGTRAAASGGFTTIVCMPNTQPVIDCKARIRDIFEKIREKAVVHVIPTAALSLGLRGKKLARFDVLAKEGVVVFSDDGVGTSDKALFKEALKQISALGLVLLTHCEDHDLSRFGVMHAGRSARKLGLTGISAQSENVAITRAIECNRKTQAKLHIQHVSTIQGVAAIRLAKKSGIRVTGEVTPHHLFLNAKHIEQSASRSRPDPNLKMKPPLRTERDRICLLKALSNGCLDVLASDHAPHSMREKSLGFKKAPFGVTGLETTLPLVLKLVEDGHVNLERAVEMLTIGPARILGLQAGTLRPGMPADVTVVDPEKKWKVIPSRMKSRSKNSAFLGWEMKGKAEWTIVAGRIVHRTPSEGR